MHASPTPHNGTQQQGGGLPLPFPLPGPAGAISGLLPPLPGPLGAAAAAGPAAGASPGEAAPGAAPGGDGAPEGGNKGPSGTIGTAVNGLIGMLDADKHIREAKEEIEALNQSERDLGASVVVHVITWSMLAGAVYLAWESAMGKVFARLDDEQATALSRGKGVTRPFLCALVMYALTVVWFRVMFMLAMVYLVTAVALMSANFIPNLMLVQTIIAVLNPNVVLHCISSEHLAFHAVCAIICCLFPLVPIFGYIKDADIQAGNHSRARAKFSRIIMAVAVVMMVSYVVYMFRNIVRCAFEGAE